MIACIFYKKILQRSIDRSNQPLPAGAQRHVRECPACRRFYELERELTRRLVADAQMHSQEAPPFLRGRIMASLDRPLQEKAAPNSLHPVWVAAIVLIGLGLFSLSLFQRTQRPR